MKTPAPVGAAATALGSRKLAVPAKSKAKLGSGMRGSSTSSVPGPSSVGRKTHQRLALTSMAPMQSCPELGFDGMGRAIPGLRPSSCDGVRGSRGTGFCTCVAASAPRDPYNQGALVSLSGSVASLGPSVATTSFTSAACATVGKGGRRKKWVSVNRAIQLE